MYHVVVICALATASPATAQTDPRKDYIDCVLQCHAQYEGCFANNITSLADSRNLLDKRRLAKLQEKELTSLYNCFRTQGDCYAKCGAAAGRD